ncbi:hypothetical protein KAU04_08510, partial [bacterium]|nr:hypothetical protein [bacterium]
GETYGAGEEDGGWQKDIDLPCRGVLQYARPNLIEFRSPSQTVGARVRGFKSGVTKRINVLRKTPYAPVWQRNYWDRVLRNERDLNRRREYIMNNPLKWELDRENPDN